MHHNCLLFNTENNGYDGDTNAWDDGSEGNRWSDWQPPEHPDADGDGIVDEPRPIMAGSNQDRYPIVFGVRVGISPSENSAEPCTTLEYVVKVMNLKYVDDNFDLTWVDNAGWGDNIWLGDTSLSIQRCGSEKTTTLYVHIPYGVQGCTEDNITVFVTSQTDNTVVDNYSCIAHVAVVKGVEVSISPEYQSGEPSTVLDYTVTVRNTGNVDDVYDLSWADNVGWGDNIWLEDNSLSAARHGGENSTTLHVHVPECTEGSTEDNITVTATSQSDNTVSDDDSCIAHVAIVRGVEVSISPSENEAEPCNWLEYTVTVRNTGNVDGYFDLSWTDTEGWGDNIWLEDNMLWVGRCDGENSTTLHVHIPWCVEGSTWDNITVTATSQDNTNVKGSDTCRAHVDIVRGVDISISPSEDSGEPGATLTYTITVKNMGNVGDTFDLTLSDNAGWGDNIWLEDNSLWVDRCYGENTTTLYVYVPHGVEGCTNDNITVTATSQSDNTVSDNDSCIAHVAIVRGVEVSILPEENSAEPCTTLKYTVTVTNTGNVDNTFDLTVIDNENWSPTLDDSSLSIPFGESQTTTISVHIPENAIGCTRDNITVTATGTGVESSASCIAHVEIVRGVDVSILPDYQEGLPGETLEYEVTVTNTGNVDDTFDLTVIDSMNWDPTISENSLWVPARGKNTTTLSVKIPEKTFAGKKDNITVTASGTDVENSASAIANTGVVRGVDVEISPTYQENLPGENLIYIVTVTNTGNVGDNYDLSVSQTKDWEMIFWFTFLNLPPYSSAQSELTVIIPENAIPGTQENITVTAVSKTDNTVTDSDSCIAQAKIIRDVEVFISPENRIGLGGENLTYTITVANKGNVPDNYALENIDTLGWVLSISEELLEVENGMSQNVTLTVAIPDNAMGRTLDNITVTATSQENENIWNSETCLARVRVVVGVDVRIEPSWLRYFLGENLSYAVTVVNTGNVPDNYTLTIEDNAGWGPWLSENRLDDIWPGENKPVTLIVTIPENATPCTEDNIIVEATSAENAEKSENASCIAHATVPKVEFSFITLYKVRLNVNILVENGSKLVAKFYKYDNTTFQTESVIDVFTPPKHVENIENVRHPLGLPVEIVTVFLTTDNTEEVIYTVASFVVRKIDLEIRFSKIPSEWFLALPPERTELETEFSKIPSAWFLAPS